MTADYTFMDLGPLTLVSPLTDAAREHLESHTDGTWTGGALAVEPRYAPALSALLCRAGFAVELPDGRVVTEENLL